MEIKDYTEVLNSQQIDTIVDLIKEVEQDYYGLWEPDRIEIKFGQFIDGICLIYVDTSSWDENFSKGIASYIVNKEGLFLGITVDNIYFDGTKVYLPDPNVTLCRMTFQRVYSVKPEVFNSTDNYSNYFWRKQSPTCNIIFSLSYSEGDTRNDYYDDDFEVLRKNTNESHSRNGIIRSTVINHEIHLQKIYETEIGAFTNILIGNCDLLLKSELEPYDYGQPRDYETEFKQFFPQILVDDAYKPRYGLFDLNSLKVKIHCGELDYLAGYINGFRKIEFKYGQIFTYDKFDLSNGNGVLYSQRMVVPQKKTNKICDPINVISYPNKKLEENTSQNAGPLYIVRSGKEAGRNISWLKYNKPNSLLKYVSSGNIHIAFMLMFVGEGLSKGYKKKLLIANDLHNDFLDIFTPDDILFPEYINSVHMGFLMTYSNHNSFEKLVDYDVDYVKILIKNRSLYIHSNVFEILRERKINDIQYLQKLDSIQSLLSEIRDEDERRVEDDDSDDYVYWQEEEERRFYENEGYRDAYDGNPDAVWNND